MRSFPVLKGSFTQGGQFQIIIGNKVSTFYDDFVEASGIEGVSKAEVKTEAKGNLNLLQRLLANLAEIFAPIIPAIIVGGLILDSVTLSAILRFWKTEQKQSQQCIRSGMVCIISSG